MATIKDKLKETAKKVTNQISEAVKNNSNLNTSNNSSSTNDSSWIGSGVSPRTGEATYGGSAKTGTAISNGSTYEDDLARLKRLQQDANVQQLKAQKDKTMQALAEREATVKPTFQNQRNATSAQSQRSARSFNEYLANRGLAHSGAGAQAEINRALTLQNNLAAINTAETNELNEIARARANAEADYANNLAIANSQIEADYFGKLVEENQRQRLIDEQLRERALGQYSGDYMARRNELIAQGYSPNSREVMMIDAARGDKMVDFTNSTKQNALQQILAGNINYNTARYAGFNSVDEAIRYYNDAKAAAEEKARLEAEDKAWNRYVEETQLNNATALNEANIKNKNASTANYYNQIENRNAGGAGNENVIPSESAQKNYIENTFGIKDTYGDFVGYDNDAILQYIQTENENGRMTNKTAINLLYNYGFKDIADQLSAE